MTHIFSGGITRYFAVAGLALAIPLSVVANSGGPRGAGGPAECGGEKRGGERAGAEMGRAGMGGGEIGAHYLRGLNLSDAQRDKVFEIVHGQAPLVREKAKAQHKAVEDLRLLTVGPDYSEAKAKALADTLGKAVFEMTLARAKADRQIFEVLTPEQRKQLAEMKLGADEPQRGMAGEGRNPPPAR